MRRLKIHLALKGLAFAAIAMITAPALSQNDPELVVAAIESLMTVPPARAVPLLERVIEGDHSLDVKERAVFILSQIESREAEEKLLELASDQNSDLQHEAIRSIGITGAPQSLESLVAVHAGGSPSTRTAVFKALLIADRPDLVRLIGGTAETQADFDEALQTLVAMGAVDELRSFYAAGGTSARSAHEFAVVGDLDSLRAIAGSNVASIDLKRSAIAKIGMVGNQEAAITLKDLFLGSNNPREQDTVLNWLVINGEEAILLALYRQVESTQSKQSVLQALSEMGSEALLEAIEETLE